MPKPIKVGRKERMTFSKINEVGVMPNLIEIQTSSYDWFIKEGLREVFEDISPIRDYADNLILEFIDYSLNDPPKYEQEECKERDVTYAAPLKVRVRLDNKETGEVKEQEVFMGDCPLMTEKGTFIYNVHLDLTTALKLINRTTNYIQHRLSRTEALGWNMKRTLTKSFLSGSTEPESSL